MEELQQIVYNAGIVGAGGAGFPTHKKLANGIETVLVNAAECEPLLKVDYFLLNHYYSGMALALKEVVEAVGAKEGIIAVKGKNIKNQLLLEDLYDNVRVQEINDVYPAGDEVVLTYEVTGKIIPEGSIPLSVGIIVLNAETLINISKAMVGAPVTHKYVSIAGDVPQSTTLKVPVGMPIKELFKYVGITDLKGKKVISGGPLMGNIIDIENEYVTKTTKGLIVLPESHALIHKKEIKSSIAINRATGNCCQCRMCTDMCPRYLLGYNFEVHKTVRSVANEVTQDANVYLQNALCCQCGICDYIACAQDICPRKVAGEVKTQMAKLGIRRKGGYQPEHVRPERKYRQLSSHRVMERMDLQRYVKDVKFGVENIEVDEIRLPLRQHIGKPCEPVVKVGDQVKMGDLVAKVNFDEMGALIHSSIDGTVKAIENGTIVIGR